MRWNIHAFSRIIHIVFVHFTSSCEILSFIVGVKLLSCISPIPNQFEVIESTSTRINRINLDNKINSIQNQLKYPQTAKNINELKKSNEIFTFIQKRCYNITLFDGGFVKVRDEIFIFISIRASRKASAVTTISIRLFIEFLIHV